MVSMYGGMFSSISDVSLVNVSSSLTNGDNRKCCQKVPNVPWDAKSSLVEHHLFKVFFMHAEIPINFYGITFSVNWLPTTSWHLHKDPTADNVLV